MKVLHYYSIKDGKQFKEKSNVLDKLDKRSVKIREKRKSKS